MSVASITWRTPQRGIVADPSGHLKQVDRHEVAARLRALLAPALGTSRLRTVAARLNVTTSALRASIEQSDPYPTASVVLAMVRQYGVDPTWILTGAYNAATHREALENPESVVRLLARITLRNDLLERPPPRPGRHERHTPDRFVDGR